jgi:hypothetical protein
LLDESRKMKLTVKEKENKIKNILMDRFRTGSQKNIYDMAQS